MALFQILKQKTRETCVKLCLYKADITSFDEFLP